MRGWELKWSGIWGALGAAIGPSGNVAVASAICLAPLLILIGEVTDHHSAAARPASQAAAAASSARHMQGR